MPNVAARRVYLPPGSGRRLVPRWVGSLVALAVGLTLAGVFGAAYWPGYRLRREAAALAHDRDQLRRQNAQLREEIRLLHAPEYIERVAREQLGLVRPDEIAVMVTVPTPAPTRRVERPKTEPSEPNSPWWWRLFGR